MNSIPVGILFAVLVVLIVLSGFFSGSETALMTLNRYRLRHLSQSGHRGARIAEAMLRRPDRLIGLILLGNNFVNILASSVATLIALRLIGDSGIFLSTVLLTVIILIFSEVTPKTVAALHPERFAFPASFVLSPLLRMLYPFVWLINLITNNLLALVGIRVKDIGAAQLSREELRSVVNEAGAMIPRRHQRMLTNILDLEKATVEDIMIPRGDIDGIDLSDDWPDILEALTNAQYTRLPVFRGSIDHVEGILHARQLVEALRAGNLDRDKLVAAMNEPYFIPEGTPLNVQLLNFQARRRRIGLVVDEYGDIMGLVTLEDLLEEIVGEFTTDPAAAIRDVEPQADGTFLVEGSVSIRELNRLLNWELPTHGPKTFNGVILEYMETIPEPGTQLKLQGYPVTIVQLQDNRVKTARIHPRERPSRRAAEHEREQGAD